MEKFEPTDYKTKAIEKFTDELEDLITNPKYANRGYDTAMVEKVKNGQKIKADQLIEQKLVMAGQDFRLTWQEIDQLKKEIFE